LVEWLTNYARSYLKLRFDQFLVSFGFSFQVRPALLFSFCAFVLISPFSSFRGFADFWFSSFELTSYFFMFLDVLCVLAV